MVVKGEKMSLIPLDIQNQVRNIFQTIEKPVKLLMFTQGEGGKLECSTCEETQELLEEVAGLSDKVEFQSVDLATNAAMATRYNIEKIPAIVILGGQDSSKNYGIRMFGIPSGYEFSSLIEDILLVSRGASELSAKTLTEIGKLENPVHIQVFVTPTCPYCPRAVILAHKLALASDKITADVVEANEFPELSNRYQVYGVPRTVINEVVHIEGALPEAELVAKMMKVLDKKEMDRLTREWNIRLN
jgi:glutaredoxin-like protein